MGRSKTTNRAKVAVATIRAAAVWAVLLSGSARARTLAVPQDYNSIQAAINDASAGDTVLVKSGVYDEPLTFKNGIRLVGADVNGVRITGVSEENAVIVVKDCNQGFISGVTVEPNRKTDISMRPLSGIKIANSTIEIEHCVVKNVSGSGIHGIGESVVKVRRCILESNARMGIWLRQGAGVIASNNVFKDNGEGGLYAEQTKRRVLVEDNKVLGNKRSCISLVRVKDATVTGNICEDNGGIGISVHGQATGNILLKGNSCRRNNHVGMYCNVNNKGLVENNTCEGNSTNGMIIFGKYVTVRGNSCNYNLRSGLEVQAAMGDYKDQSKEDAGASGVKEDWFLRLEGNSCAGNSEFGIVGTRSPVIFAKKNVCRRNGKDGIQFNRVESVTMEGNVSEENKRGGIVVSASEVRTTVNGNRSLNNEGNGIYFSESSNVEVRNNESRSNGIAGIYVRQSAAVMVKENTCSDNDLHGIQLTDGTALVAEGNLCQGNDWPGILVEGKGTSARLIRNRCFENNHSGIVFHKEAGGGAEGNICERNPWSGIAVRGTGTKPALTANKCSNNGAWGIISWAGAEPTIEGDNVTLNNGREGVKRR